jgi:signal peptidase I
MRPLLQGNDLIYYRKVSFDSIRENDLVLIRKKGVLFTHRVIYKTPDYLVTKGDNNAYSDGIIKPRNIIAKATRLKRNGKTIKLDELYMVQSLLYFHEIEQVTASIQRKGVDVLILKGLPLHLYYQGKRPKRIYGDCDLLIRNKDAQKVQMVLKRLGYRKLNSDLSPGHSKILDKKTEESYFKILGTFPIIFDVHYEVVFMMTQVGKLDRLYH